MPQKTTYGVLGTSQNIPREVVVASLDDTVTSAELYVIPWYGTKKISQGLEYVYDWVLDTEAKFRVLAMSDGREVPAAIRKNAEEVVTVEDVDSSIVTILSEVPSTRAAALVMWDDEQAERSLTLASMSLSNGLRTLELTNGLVPIIVDDQDEDLEVLPVSEPETPRVKINFKKKEEDLPEIDPSGFDRETLEVMPAASVKRMAKNAGFDVKTKEDAIDALRGIVKPSEDGSKDIGTILLIFDDGTEMGFSLNLELLKELMNVVIDFQSR